LSIFYIYDHKSNNNLKMKHKIVKIDNKKYKVFGYTEDKIIFSSKNHKNFESLLGSLEKSSFIETINSISINTMEALSYNESSKDFKTVYLNEKGKKKKEVFVLNSKDERDNIVKDIAAINTSFNQVVVPESKMLSLGRKILLMALISGGFYWLRIVAVKAEAGEHLDVGSGRNRGILQIIVNLTEAIGSIGITVIGLLVLIYVMYLTVINFMNPPNEITYS